MTPNSVLLGQSVALTGPAAALGIEMRIGAKVYFDYVNSKGGVHGRKIELRTLDDGYEPARTVPNTKKLIEEDKVFALFGYVGTPTSAAALPVFTQAKVPFFGAFTGAELLRDPFNPYIFNVRASYYDETEKIVEQLVSTGAKNIAVFYQNDAYGQAGLKGVERAMTKRNLKISATGTVERNTIDVAAAVKAIRAAQPDAVVMISAYKSCARIHPPDEEGGQRGAVLQRVLRRQQGAFGQPRQRGRRRRDLAGDAVPLGAERAGGQGIPATHAQGRAKGLFLYHASRAMSRRRYSSRGCRRAGKDLNREKFIAALETMNDVDVGGYFVSFSPKKPQRLEIRRPHDYCPRRQIPALGESLWHSVSTHSSCRSSGAAPLQARQPPIPRGGLPLIGHLPVARQLQVLTGLLVLLLLVDAAIVVMDARQATFNTLYVASVGKIRMLSQRLAKAAQQASQGNRGGVQATARKPRRVRRAGQAALSNGGAAGGVELPPTPARVRPALNGLVTEWKKSERNAGLVIGEERNLVAFGKAVRSINTNNPDLLELADEVAALSVQSGGSARQNAVAAQLVMLTQRMAKNANTMLAGDVVDPEVAFLLGKDTNTFRDTLQGLLQGSADAAHRARQRPGNARQARRTRHRRSRSTRPASATSSATCSGWSTRSAPRRDLFNDSETLLGAAEQLNAGYEQQLAARRHQFRRPGRGIGAGRAPPAHDRQGVPRRHAPPRRTERAAEPRQPGRHPAAARRDRRPRRTAT